MAAFVGARHESFGEEERVEALDVLEGESRGEDVTTGSMQRNGA